MNKSFQKTLQSNCKQDIRPKDKQDHKTINDNTEFEPHTHIGVITDDPGLNIKYCSTSWNCYVIHSKYKFDKICIRLWQIQLVTFVSVFTIDKDLQQR